MALEDLVSPVCEEEGYSEDCEDCDDDYCDLYGLLLVHVRISGGVA
jgi:hypothetical protein